jgi:galactonate dehydratase
MKRLREAVGEEVEICLDVHTRMNLAQAMFFCREVEPYHPFFVEDPLRAENPANYITLARSCGVPIAAGEQWPNKWAFREAVESEAIHFARVDLGIAGGITEALKIAHMCEVHSVEVCPHNPLGPISTAACTNLCMAVSNASVLEVPHRPGTRANHIFPVQMEWEDGSLRNPGRPGLGVEFDEAEAGKNRREMNNWPPRLRRLDGSFTNW